MGHAILIGTQVLALLIFAVVALVKVYGGDAGEGSVDPSLSWLNPFGGGDSFNALVLGLLTGVFIYWGWESTVNLNEETEDSDSTPGKAALVSTVVLLLTYLLVTFAVVSYAGVEGVSEFEDDVAVLGSVAEGALGQPRLHRDHRHHHLGDRLGADHDPAGLADAAVDGAPEGDARTASDASTRASRRRTWPPRWSAGWRWPGTCSSTCCRRTSCSTR